MNSRSAIDHIDSDVEQPNMQQSNKPPPGDGWGEFTREMPETV